MDDNKQQRVAFKKPSEVSHALKVLDVGLMSRALTDLREQLVDAIKGRVDPLEKGTKPLVEYIQSCTDGSDLIRLWNYQATNNIQSLECLVPDVIGLFIRLCSTPIIRPFGTSLIQTILQQQLKYIHRGVSSARIPQSQSTFKLLVAMSSFSTSAAQDVFHELNFQSEGYIKASRCRQLKKSNNPSRYIYDLRTNYVQLVLSFFIHGDAETKKKALATRGLLYNVFMGIDKDAYQLIEEILSTTYEHIFMDHSIPRSAKLQFFSTFILEQIAKVYVRKEPEPTGESESAVPADLVHHFLLSVCTVPGMGVCFRDAGWYPANTGLDIGASQNETTTAEKVQNRILSRFIPKLRPADDMHQQELLLKILAVCPELVQGYWQSKSAPFEPSLGTHWLSNVTVLQKCIQLPVPSMHYGDTEIYPATPPQVGIILENILPKTFGRLVSSKGLQHSSPLVRYFTMVVLAAAFQKFKAVTDAMEHVISYLSQQQDDHSPVEEKQRRKEASEKWKTCVDRVRDGLRRRVPEIQTLVTLHSHVSGQKSAQPESEDQEVVTQRITLQNVAFRLIRYYQELLPEAMLEGGVDSSRFIPSDILSVEACSLVHLLELLLSLPNFRWSNKAAGTSFSYITTLFTLYLQTPFNYIRDLTSRLIHQTLAESTMFRHDPKEIDLWLEALPRNHLTKAMSLSKDQTHILQFLDDCIVRFEKMQHRFMDQLVKIVEDTNAEHFEAHVTPATHQLLQHLLGSDGTRMTTNEYIHPFSPLLLVIVERLKFVNTDKSAFIHFFSRILVLLLKKQKIPFYLQHICGMITPESTATIDPSTVDTWTETQMIQQASLCISMKAEALMNIDIGPQPGPESRLKAILARKRMDDLAVAQKEFIDVLDALPTHVVVQHLLEMVEYCRDTLLWNSLDPLVSYICDRFPLAGNLFDCKVIMEAPSGDTQSETITRLLQCVPFDILLHNAWRYHDYSSTSAFLKRAMDAATVSYPTQCLTLILEYLSILLLSDDADEMGDRLEFILDLLVHSLTAAKSQKDVRLRSRLYCQIFEHPAVMYLNVKLVELAHQLQHRKTYPKTMDAKLLKVAAAYVDLFGEGTRACTLVESLSHIDYEALRGYCEQTGQIKCYEHANRLLRVLVGQLCHRQRQGDVGSQALPKESLVVIAQQWRSHPSKDLDADMLSLLENTTTEEGLMVLLNICCEPLIESLLKGRKCQVQMESLKVACKNTSVDVSAIVLDHLDHMVITPTAIELIKLGYLLMDSCEESTFVYIRRVFERVLQRLTTMVSTKDVAKDVYTGLNAMAGVVTGFAWPQLDEEIVRDFVYAMVLNNIANAAAIQCSGTLIKLVYQMSEKREQIETYIHRVLFHEQYKTLCLPKARAEANECNTEAQEECRLQIISLIHILDEIQPTIFASQYHLLDPLLTSYSATTSVADRLILRTALSCERHGCETVLPKLLLWGPGSDTLRQTHLQSGTLLQASTISATTLHLIDPALMKYTFTHFPFDSPLETSDHDLSSPSTTIYDIGFFLPLFANIVSSGAVDCRRFIECNALGLVVVSLSSVNDTVRKLGYQIMDQFYVMLEYANFRDKGRVAFLLNVLKNSIHGRNKTSVPPRIPAPITVCVSHALSIILHPSHYMLPHIAKWITQSSTFDFQYIPMYSALLTSTSPNQRNERLWMLRVLSSSLGTYEDYTMFERHHIWDMIAVIYNSALSDPASKRAILEILDQAVKIPAIASSLVRYNGLLTWIHQVLALCPENEESRAWTDLLTVAVESAKLDDAMVDAGPLLDEQLMSIRCATSF